MIGAWWHAQTVRDRRVLVVGAIIVAVLLVWALAWLPLSRARAGLAVQVAQQRTDLAWMRQALGQARALDAQGSRGTVARQGMCPVMGTLCLEQLDQLCQGRVDSVVMVHLIPARQAMLSRGSFGPTQAIRR